MGSGEVAVGQSALLELTDVEKAYETSGKRFVAVDGVSIGVRSGEFVCLVGPSGCGKSTLLRIVTGLDRPTRGSVVYRGAPLTGVNPHATIVFQTFALFPWLSVEENVELALKARGVGREERHKKALQLIDAVGLDGFESAYPRELSGGMRQKVGFARALAVEPELLCLDEPFSALDVLSAEALRSELLELWQSGTVPIHAVLMVTHNIEEAVLMADRIIVMAKNPGRVLAEIPVSLRRPRHRKDTAFQALVDTVYSAVAGRTAEEATGVAPGQPGRTPPLPNARPNALNGLVERVAEEGGSSDLYRLAGGLGLELDDLLPVVEGGEMLGFLIVAEGDVRLTPIGTTYAEASVLARKEIVAGRVLRHPLLAWIYETLRLDDDGRVARDYLADRLATVFGNLAEEQLNIAIGWGRQAELFAYDAETSELYLEG